MNAVDGFELSTKSSFKQFEFSIDDFKLEIDSATLIIPTQVNWQQLLTKFEIRVHVIADEVLHYSGPLHLFIDPNSNHPFFELNAVIDQRILGSDIELSTISKIIVRIELIQFENSIEPFVLYFKQRPIFN
jgi:hypothetical protein